MDRRTVLALVLVTAVVLLTPKLFPTTARPGTQAPATAAPAPSAPATAAPAPTVAPLQTEASADSQTVAVTLRVDTTIVAGSTADIRFTSLGAAPLSATLKQHRALSATSGSVVVEDPSLPLLRFRLLRGRDTVDLSGTTFVREQAGDNGLRYQADVGGYHVQIAYEAKPDSYLVHMSGSVAPNSAGQLPAFLLVDLPTSLASYEADTVADHQALSFAVKPYRRRAEAVPFRSMDPGERKLIAGPVSWVVAKNKYFMFGYLAADGDSSYREVQAVGGPRQSRVPTHAQATIIHAIGATGTFAADLYVGPQEYKRLIALGRDFENSNPYGGWLQGVVQPFATLVMRVLLWMKSTLPVGYGWILIIFGVTVRVLLWPLNQRAMRSSLKMQRIQPELSAIQAKYKGDPQKLQSEMMRVYKEHGMSPFSAFSGCLPLLIPMPVFFALFFVFQNTIEFRGVPFLWLPDISIKDPFYITPLLMGVTMFVMSWIGLRNSPPNQQAKTMAYVLPVVMTVMFANFASGLNMYYAVQNLAAIPQQWLIANERAKSAGKG